MNERQYYFPALSPYSADAWDGLNIALISSLDDYDSPDRVTIINQTQFHEFNCLMLFYNFIRNHKEDYFVDLTDEQINELGMGVMFHDTGKFTMDPQVYFNRNGGQIPDTQELLAHKRPTEVESHPETGEVMLKTALMSTAGKYFAEGQYTQVIDMCKNHHAIPHPGELFGYPQGVPAYQDLSVYELMLSIIDRFESITSNNVANNFGIQDKVREYNGINSPSAACQQIFSDLNGIKFFDGDGPLLSIKEGRQKAAIINELIHELSLSPNINTVKYARMIMKTYNRFEISMLNKNPLIIDLLNEALDTALESAHLKDP